MQNKVYHKVEQITGNVIVIKASNVIAGELAQVDSNNNLSLAQVIRLEDEMVYLQVFTGGRGIGTDAKV